MLFECVQCSVLNLCIFCHIGFRTAVGQCIYDVYVCVDNILLFNLHSFECFIVLRLLIVIVT